MPATDYTIDPVFGVITDPGKFENERPEVVTAYELYLDGCADSDEDGLVIVTLPSGEIISFYEDNYGFINEVRA